ncbi:hypothetical protein Tco_0367533 [Tanacetum coccineum]
MQPAGSKIHPTHPFGAYQEPNAPFGGFLSKPNAPLWVCQNPTHPYGACTCGGGWWRWRGVDDDDVRVVMWWCGLARDGWWGRGVRACCSLLWRRWGGGGDDVDRLVGCGVGWRGGGVGCGGDSGGGWPESGRSGAKDGREEREEYGG